MGAAAVGAVLAEVGRGFVICLAVAAFADLLLRRWSGAAARAPAAGARNEAARRRPATGAHDGVESAAAAAGGAAHGACRVAASGGLPGPGGVTDLPGRRRGGQWRALMVVSLGRLAADAVGLVLVFFLLADVWALIGGALGLLSWRVLGLALTLRRLPGRSAGPHEEAVS